MISLNKVHLIGNITADPEVTQTSSWKFVARFGLATNRVWKDNSWKKEQIEFHNIVFWWKLAEVIWQYLKKWNKIYIDWRLQTSHWEDKTWVKKYKTEIIGEGLIMLGLPQQKQAKIIETVIEDSKEEEEELDEEVVVETKKKKKKWDLEEVPF